MLVFSLNGNNGRSSVTVVDENVLVMVFVADCNRPILPSSHSFQIDIVNTVSIARGPSTGCVIHLERHIVRSFIRCHFRF